MNKKAFIILVFIAALLFASCTGREQNDKAEHAYDALETTGGSSNDNAVASKELISEEETEGPVKEINERDENFENIKILIAYFTWADNTYVENPDEVDTDATTSASVLPPGNTGKIAEWIREETGGDVFRIIVTEPYSSDYDECLDRAADEKKENARPLLTAQVDNMEEYDVVFLGYPNWWYTAPMAIFSFVEEYDLSGKKVIPFCAHGTGGLASSVKDITAKLKDSEILEPFSVYRPDVDSAQEDVNTWIKNLDIAKNK